MSRTTFEQWRIPAALILIVIAAFVLWPRGGEEPASAVVTPSPAPSVIVGEPGGEVLPASPVASSASAVPSASAPPSQAATPEPTPTTEPTEAPTAAGWEVFACRSISGPACNGEITTMPPDLASFTALVRFDAASAGDTLNATLTGPNGSTSGGAYTLQGSGAGHYYTTFNVPNLPAGNYTLVATRNGDEVATTTFTKEG